MLVAQNPVWALCLGTLISLFVWRRQTLLAHRLQELEVKRGLCQSFVRQVDFAIFKTEVGTSYAESPEMMHLLALKEEIALISSDELVNCCKCVVEAVAEVTNGESYERTVHTSSDGQSRKAIERVFFERSQFTINARKELKL